MFCKLHVNKRIKHNLITLLLNVRKGEENGLKLLKGIIVSKFRQVAKKINTKGFDGCIIILFFVLFLLLKFMFAFCINDFSEC